MHALRPGRPDRRHRPELTNARPAIHVGLCRQITSDLLKNCSILTEGLLPTRVKRATLKKIIQVMSLLFGLTPDAWTNVGTCLKPRHLAKLLQTNKALCKVLDNETYWTRVAAHLVWRGSDCLELHTREFPEEEDRLPVLEEHNLYYMLGLERGYKWGIDLFIDRIQAAIDAYSTLPDGPGPWWAEFKVIPSLRDRTVKFYTETTGQHWYGIHLPYIKGDEQQISMKELAKRVTEQDWIRGKSDTTRKILKAFVCKMEDADIPPASKRYCFRELNTLFWRLAANGLEIAPTEIGMDICLF